MQNFTKIAPFSVKWFYILLQIKLGVWYEPGNIDVNKVCFA